MYIYIYVYMYMYMYMYIYISFKKKVYFLAGECIPTYDDERVCL